MAVAERILHLRPDTDTRPDRALVHEAQHGREEAATVLYRRYYPRIYSFVSHLTYGRANAEDLTQEVFVRALKALGRCNGQYRFEHWLLRIAKNLCIDEARRNVHQPALTDPGELPELEGIPAPDYVWESVSRDLVASVVRRALAALPPRQRAVLVMREMEGMSYADIAQVVGTNPRGVEATLRRARARFRTEVPRAESAEEAAALCRRVLRLVSEDPEASSSSPEAATHLARCADCRRRAEVIGSALPAASQASQRRSFGFLPPIIGLGTLLRGQSVGSALRRVSDRLRDSVPMAGLGTSAAMAVPLARMAEVTAGVFVATAVTLAPLSPAAHAAGVATATQVEPAAAPQVASVAPVSVLFRSSPAAPVTAAPTTAAPQAPAALQVPSIVAPDATAAIPALLAQLGLTPGQDAVASTLNNVSTIS